jgi:hypothetical protein
METGSNEYTSYRCIENAKRNPRTRYLLDLDRAMDVIARIKEHLDALRRATYVLTRVAKCIDVDGGIFENELYYVNCTDLVTWTVNTGIGNST